MAVNVAVLTRFAPSPGATIAAIVIAIAIAIAVVNIYKEKAFPPTFPRVATFPIPQTPDISENRTKGTTNIFKAVTNIFPAI